MKRSAIVLVAAGLLCSMPANLATAAENSPRPNIVLCMADDQGWGDVAYNGHPKIKTPVLDEMARSGLRFDRFYAAAPVCSPTRGSVLTGRHPNRFAAFSWGHPLRPQEVTIAEALKRAGYTTGHFGKWHLGTVRADSKVSPGQSGFDVWLSSPNFYENDALMSRNGKVVQCKGESSMIAMDAALDFIRKTTRKKQPFLAVVWFGSPHTPHIASDEMAALYDDLPKRLKNYLGEITGIDRAMGKLRKELRTLGIADNTLVWYTSDNGARKPGSTGGLRGHKGTLWEGGVRVPAIIEWPAKIRSPRTTDLPCNTVDIYPTILELLGVRVDDQPRPIDGVSLVPLLNGKMDSRPKGMGFWKYPAKGRSCRSTELLQALAKEQETGEKTDESLMKDHEPDPITGDCSKEDRPGHAAWIDGRYKLHRLPGKAGKVRYALYDLVADSKEKTDLSGKEPQRVEKMKRALEAWQESVIDSINGEDYAKK